MNLNDDLAPEWDALLNEGLIKPPSDFQARVMQRVQLEGGEQPTAQPSKISAVANAIQLVAVLLGALAAGWQTLSFIFGLWATSLAI